MSILVRVPEGDQGPAALGVGEINNGDDADDASDSRFRALKDRGDARRDR